jgi:hypothetical protein
VVEHSTADRNVPSSTLGAPCHQIKKCYVFRRNETKLLHNDPLKFGTVARVFVGGMREQMMITIGLMCTKNSIKTPCHCVIEEKVLSGKREIIKKMSTSKAAILCLVFITVCVYTNIT